MRGKSVDSAGVLGSLEYGAVVAQVLASARRVAEGDASNVDISHGV